MNVKYRIFITIFLLIFAALSMFSCASGKPDYEKDLQANFDRGVELYEKGKYYKAVDFFTFVVFNSPGSEIADDAQLYLGDCHFGLKEYIVAVDEYRRLINRWPASDLVEQARFRTAKALHELSPQYQLYQNYTEEAIDAYQRFIEFYPGSELRQEAEDGIWELRLKLARKIFDSGELYMVFREWKAALITFEEIEKYYYDTEIIDLTYLKMAQCHDYRGDAEERDKYLGMINRSNIEKSRNKILLEELSGK